MDALLTRKHSIRFKIFCNRKTHEIQNSMRQYFGSMSNRTDESNIEIKQP